MPIACLALRRPRRVRRRAPDSACVDSHKRVPRALAAVAIVLFCGRPARAGVRRSRGRTRPSTAYAAIRGDGRLLELPVFRPDVHFGSAYLAYARQSPESVRRATPRSPRPAPSGSRASSGVSRAAAARFRSISGSGSSRSTGGCTRRAASSGRMCPERAEAMLRADGWRLLARDGPIATYAREGAGPP